MCEFDTAPSLQGSVDSRHLFLHWKSRTPPKNIKGNKHASFDDIVFYKGGYVLAAGNYVWLRRFVKHSEH